MPTDLPSRSVRVRRCQETALAAGAFDGFGASNARTYVSADGASRRHRKILDAKDQRFHGRMRKVWIESQIVRLARMVRVAHPDVVASRQLIPVVSLIEVNHKRRKSLLILLVPFSNQSKRGPSVHDVCAEAYPDNDLRKIVRALSKHAQVSRFSMLIPAAEFVPHAILPTIA